METWYKIDSSFPTAGIYMDSFTTYRRDRNINGGSIILYIRDGISSTLLNTETSTKDLYVEINVRKRKWLIEYPCNPHKMFISAHLKELGKDLDIYSPSYDSFFF